MFAIQPLDQTSFVKLASIHNYYYYYCVHWSLQLGKFSTHKFVRCQHLDNCYLLDTRLPVEW